jgi:hypothetical protein
VPAAAVPFAAAAAAAPADGALGGLPDGRRRLLVAALVQVLLVESVLVVLLVGAVLVAV